MGATPTFALNIFGFPINDLPNEVAGQILKGGSDKANEAGIPILGGHSIDDKEPKYGLIVNGVVNEDKLIRNSGANSGDVLILTKPIGTGIISTALKNGQVQINVEKTAIESMKALNKDAANLMHEHKVNAATDVTGFGLLGHLYEMLKNSSLSATVNFENVPLISDIHEYLDKGIYPSGSQRNLDYLSENIIHDAKEKSIQILCDAQTNGGLLIAIPKDQEIKSSKNMKVNEDIWEIGEINTKYNEKINII